MSMALTNLFGIEKRVNTCDRVCGLRPSVFRNGGKRSARVMGRPPSFLDWSSLRAAQPRKADWNLSDANCCSMVSMILFFSLAARFARS